jgi:hypothetical protein
MVGVEYQAQKCDYGSKGPVAFAHVTTLQFRDLVPEVSALRPHH